MKKTMEYKVLSIISQDGCDVMPGDLVGIREDSAKELVRLGIVEPTGREYPVDEDHSGDQPKDGDQCDESKEGDA